MEDASTGTEYNVTLPTVTETDTAEVLEMMMGDFEDITVGRMPVGGAGDPSDFDALPRNEVEMFFEHQEDSDELIVGEEPEMFSSPADETFPVFKSALRRFQAAESPPRAVRVDTEETHGNFVCERAVEELSRRVEELRALVEAHLADGHGPSVPKLGRWRTEVIGAAEAVADLRNAESPREALKKLPEVPLDVPPFAEGKVDCWRDGDHVICSIRFLTANGQKRVATMAARPRIDSDEAARWALESGAEPAAVLGALEDLTSVACGKKLLRDVAGAALKARERFDVCGMEEGDADAEPVVLVSGPEEGTAPLAALMHLEQRAQAGDPQARREMGLIERAAKTPSGQKIAAPLIAEARARLGHGRQKKAKETRMTRYAIMGMCV